jgi:hypothetical protein
MLACSLPGRFTIGQAAFLAARLASLTARMASLSANLARSVSDSVRRDLAVCLTLFQKFSSSHGFVRFCDIGYKN